VTDLRRAKIFLMGMILLAAPAAFADWHADCRFSIERREIALDHAIARFGARSARAVHARHALYDARDACWRDHHAWWNGHAHIWVTSHW
jgi:hypothetical protein